MMLRSSLPLGGLRSMTSHSSTSVVSLSINMVPPGKDALYGFFVVSCGFGLIQQAAHRAADQVDHRDEVGLVPVT
ncbi:hypothetical protein, partial [Halomonas cibimaris]|uniref:hypothetical protein n=1 Tax=Halomonas cibimaris TaxID=657012 RepID=UPI0031D4F821